MRESLAAPERYPKLRDALGHAIGQTANLDPVRARSLAHDLDAILVAEVDRALADDADTTQDDPLSRAQAARRLSAALLQTPASDRAATIVWLRHTLDDVVGADLRDADLASVPLTGIRWSDTTQWPAGWEDYIRRRSVPAGDVAGVYIIRDGRTD